MNQNIKSSPKDVFMQLFAIVALYISAGSFLTLLFQYVNVYFPDPLNPYFNPGSPMRWAIAALIVIFPAFLWASKFLGKDLKVNPEKSELRVRKWLLYFTLFAAAGFIIGDLVTLIFNFLEGELTVRFLLKILAVLAVAASVFGYYLYDLRKKIGSFSSGAKVFIWAVIAFVAISVVFGFFVAGSPFKQRLIKFDEDRVYDLQNIQGQIVNYWIQKGRLPQTLNDLTDSISGFTPPKDPQTEEAYVYSKTGNLAFDLCAVFNLATDKSQIGNQPSYPRALYEGLNDNWSHSSGNFCFKRTIDPELYPVKK